MEKSPRYNIFFQRKQCKQIDRCLIWRQKIKFPVLTLSSRRRSTPKSSTPLAISYHLQALHYNFRRLTSIAHLGPWKESMPEKVVRGRVSIVTNLTCFPRIDLALIRLGLCRRILSFTCSTFCQICLMPLPLSVCQIITFIIVKCQA